MTIPDSNSQEGGKVAEMVSRLRAAHAATCGGTWKKGQTTHHTVTETGYRIAEFHHADDAHFCDVAHELVPLLCDALSPTPSQEGRSSLSVEGWQPIETLPMEGSALVAWFHQGDRAWVIRNCVLLCSQAYATDTPYSTRYQPSHWMPLPNPPEQA